MRRQRAVNLLAAAAIVLALAFVVHVAESMFSEYQAHQAEQAELMRQQIHIQQRANAMRQAELMQEHVRLQKAKEANKPRGTVAKWLALLSED